MKLLIMYFSPFSCYFSLLGPKHIPQHPILEHPQPLFSPKRGRPRFIPMQNRHNEACTMHITKADHWLFPDVSTPLPDLEQIYRTTQCNIPESWIFELVRILKEAVRAYQGTNQQSTGRDGVNVHNLYRHLMTQPISEPGASEMYVYSSPLSSERSASKIFG
jgi:hypothetical protein